MVSNRSKAKGGGGKNACYGLLERVGLTLICFCFTLGSGVVCFALLCFAMLLHCSCTALLCCALLRFASLLLTAATMCLWTRTVRLTFFSFLRDLTFPPRI